MMDSSITVKDFTTFIYQYLTEDSECTHIIAGEKKVRIPDTSWNSFWALYLSNNIPFEISEVCGDKNMPLCIDLHLQFSEDVEDIEVFLHHFIYQIQQILINCFKISKSQDELVCVVLENSYMTTDENDDSISHLLYTFRFPSFKINVKNIKDVFIPRFISSLEKSKIRRTLENDFLGSWDKILDFHLDGVFPVYGSTDKYEKTMVFKEIYNVFDKSNLDCEGPDRSGKSLVDPPVSTIDSAFRMPHFTHSNTGSITDELKRIIFERCQNQDTYVLPIFLSCHYGPLILTLKKTALNRTIRSSETSMRRPPKASVIEENNVSKPYDIICQLLNMLNSSRYDSKNYWLDVGRCLYNSTKDEDSRMGLEKWIQITNAKSSTFKKSDCIAQYDRFNVDHLNLSAKTIAYYAREDNPSQYNEWHRSWKNKAIKDSLSLRESDIAEAFYKMYWLKFITDMVKNQPVWYHYHDHTWIVAPGGNKISTCIMQEFIPAYRVLRTRLSRDASENQADAAVAKACDAQIQQIDKLIQKMGSATAINNVKKLLAVLFYDAEFSTLRDSNPCLTGLSNGVIEVVGDEAIFRPGKPEDYITKSTRCPYRKYSDKDADYLALKDWFRKMYPDDELLHEVLKLWASRLYGRNIDKLFPVITGDGNNAKSMLRKLIQQVFGDYCFTFEADVITQSRRSSRGPSPEMAMATGVRVIFIDEPEAEEKIKTGVWKKFTGGDDFFARMLNENGGTIKVTFMIFLLCNKIPTIENADKASKQRTYILPHLSKWVEKEHAPATEEERFRKGLFEMDPMFEDKIPRMVSPFLYLLTKYYKKYKKEGLRTPKIVKEHTAKYWNDNDVWLLFCNDTVEKCFEIDVKTGKPIMGKDGEPIIDKNSKVSLSELYKRYIPWFRQNNPGRSSDPVGMPSFKYAMEQTSYGRFTSTGEWKGCKIKKTDTDFLG